MSANIQYPVTVFLSKCTICSSFTQIKPITPDRFTSQSPTHEHSTWCHLQYMQLHIRFASDSHCHIVSQYPFFIFHYVSYTVYPYAHIHCTHACLYLVRQFETQECSRVYKWTESMGPFVNVCVWAFISANVLPFELMWMFYRLFSPLVPSLFAVHIQWVWLLLLSGNTVLLSLILCSVDRASRYNCIKKNPT